MKLERCATPERGLGVAGAVATPKRGFARRRKSPDVARTPILRARDTPAAKKTKLAGTGLGCVRGKVSVGRAGLCVGLRDAALRQTLTFAARRHSRNLNAEQAKQLQQLLAASGLKVAPVVPDEEEEEEEGSAFFNKLKASGNPAKTFSSLYKTAFVPSTANLSLDLTIKSVAKGVEPKSVRWPNLVVWGLVILTLFY